MQAVIPIAGTSSRMNSAYRGPKQLLKVAGKPLIEYLLQSLPPQIKELVLIVGGPHEAAIREYFGSYHDGRSIIYVTQEEQLGLGHAICTTKDVVKGKFLVTLPDDIMQAEDLVRLAIEPELAILTYKVSNPERFGVVVTDESGHVTKLIEKPKEFISDNIITGAALFDEEFFDVKTEKSARGEYEWTDIMTKLITERGRKIKAVPASFWFPINNPQELSEAEEKLLVKMEAKAKQI